MRAVHFSSSPASTRINPWSHNERCKDYLNIIHHWAMSGRSRSKLSYYRRWELVKWHWTSASTECDNFPRKKTRTNTHEWSHDERIELSEEKLIRSVFRVELTTLQLQLGLCAIYRFFDFPHRASRIQNKQFYFSSVTRVKSCVCGGGPEKKRITNRATPNEEENLFLSHSKKVNLGAVNSSQFADFEINRKFPWWTCNRAQECQHSVSIVCNRAGANPRQRFCFDIKIKYPKKNAIPH